MSEEDLDGDGVAAWEDCDDNDSTVPTEDDADCDGIVDGCFLTSCDTSVDIGNGFGVDFVLMKKEHSMMGSPTDEVGRANNETS